MFFAFVFVLTVLILLVSWWYLEYYKYNKYLKHIPGNTPLPFLGNALDIKDNTSILPVFMENTKKFGGISKAMTGISFGFLVSDLKLTEFVLGSNKLLDKSHHYDFLKSWLGTGLLISSGEKWRKRRKAITPAFHFNILEQFVDVFNSAGTILIKKLKKEVEKTSVDIYPYITLAALDIICESAMGTKVKAQENSESEYVRSVKEMCRIFTVRSFSAIKRFDFAYKFTKDYQIERKALAVLHNYTDSVIKQRKEQFQKTKRGNEIDEFGKKKKLAFLDLLLQSTIDGQSLSDMDIREEVDTFMFEGHDTTASAMTFTLFCLANNPDVQDKVMVELKEIFGDSNKLATHRDLQEMKYLEMVIKEALRLYPSVPFFARNLHENVKFDGYTLPKDSSVLIFAYGIARNPEIFPDPEKFDPERFSPENSAGRHPYSYLPFSAGARNCIGQKFAMLEMKATVSRVLRQFELCAAVPEHKLILAAEAVLKSTNGVRIQLNNRKC